MTSRPVVELRDVRLTYPGPPTVDALRGLDLRIDAGEYVAVTGASGSGKSTLLNVIGLLDIPTAGRYLFEGSDVRGLPDARRTALRAHRIGFVFQAFHLVPTRTAAENVALAQTYTGVPRASRRSKAQALLEQVGLEGRADGVAVQLSGGERQRVAIARALANEPGLLLCDEPTGNLDSANASRVLDLLDEVHRAGQTVVVITHDPVVAARAARRVSLRDGRVEHDSGIEQVSGIEHDSGIEQERAGDPAPARAESAPGVTAGDRRSRYRPADLMLDALAGITTKPGRALLTMLGTVLGVGALVAILGLTATAAGQIDERFSALGATTVQVDDVGSVDNPADDRVSFPADASARIGRLDGVVHGGVYWAVSPPASGISASPDRTRGTAVTGLTVTAADPEALAAAGPRLAVGRLYDAFHERRHEAVVVLGKVAAQQLGIARLDVPRAVFLGDRAYTVIGVLDDVARRPELLFSVIMPSSTALADFGPPLNPRASMLVQTRLGAAQVVARQAALALRPDTPTLFKVTAPADPTTLRRGVAGDVDSLYLLLAAIAIVVGALGIANTSLVAVMERTQEIGLRRALGARARHIVAQFLAESLTLGAVGGLAGTSLAVLVVVGTAAARDWTAVLDTAVVVAAPVVGGLIGLVAGVYPASRAARVQPVEALRR